MFIAVTVAGGAGTHSRTEIRSSVSVCAAYTITGFFFLLYFRIVSHSKESISVAAVVIVVDEW